MAARGGQRRDQRQSQAYESKESAKKGITSVQTNAAGATLVDLTSATK